MGARDITRIDEVHVQRQGFSTNSSITFEQDQPYGTSKRHAPVKVIGEMQVALCADGDEPFGSLESVEGDGKASVAWHGAVEFKGTVAFGSKVVANGTGGVKAGTGGAGRGTAVSQVHTGETIVIL